MLFLSRITAVVGTTTTKQQAQVAFYFNDNISIKNLQVLTYTFHQSNPEQRRRRLASYPQL
jgi:hypothetical protein